MGKSVRLFGLGGSGFKLLIAKVINLKSKIKKSSKNPKTPNFRGKDNRKWIKTKIKQQEMWNILNSNVFGMEWLSLLFKKFHCLLKKIFSKRYQMYQHEKIIRFYDPAKMLNFAPAKVSCGQIIRDF